MKGEIEISFNPPNRGTSPTTDQSLALPCQDLSSPPWRREQRPKISAKNPRGNCPGLQLCLLPGGCWVTARAPARAVPSASSATLQAGREEGIQVLPRHTPACAGCAGRAQIQTRLASLGTNLWIPSVPPRQHQTLSMAWPLLLSQLSTGRFSRTIP